MVEITRRVEFDAGHRIPDHKSKCRNIHGHRYVLEITVEGEVVEDPGASNHGMITDFYDLKQILDEVITNEWDHAFLCWEEDHAMRAALINLGKLHRSVILPFVPTVECLANHAFSLIAHRLGKTSSAKLKRLRLYETPNCWADVTT